MILSSAKQPFFAGAELKDVLKLAEAEKAKEKAKPVKRVRDEDVDEVELERQKQAEAEAAEAEDEFDDGGAMSMSAMEAELREGVTKTLDAVAENFQRYRKLQERLVARKIEGKALTPKDYKEYDELVSAITENLKTLHLNNARIETLVEQLYEINKRLIQHEGKLMRLADLHGVGRQDFLDNYFGNELKPDWLDKVSLLSKQWKKFVTSETRKIGALRPGAKVDMTLASILDAQTRYTVIQAGSLSVGNLTSSISGTPLRAAYSRQAPMQRPARKSRSSPVARPWPW
mgnify:CR=1 FL=1